MQGDNGLEIKEGIANLSGEFGENAFLDLNTVQLDGAVLSFQEITTQLNTFPLGGSKRIVIMENAAEKLNKKETEKWLVSVLEKLSPSVLFVVILFDRKKYKRGAMVWESFGEKHWLRKVAGKFPEKTVWSEYPLPSQREMPGWINEEVDRQGGNFHPQATIELARLIGNDLFQARHEVEKAISYTGEGNQVKPADIHLLCAASKKETVFKLVDAVGQRDAKLAFKLLKELSMETPIHSIFSMLIRQIRFLILTKEALADGGSEKDVRAACSNTQAFVVKKLISQSRQFKMSTLEEIYRKMNRIDEDSKIGRVSLGASLEGLIAKITT